MQPTPHSSTVECYELWLIVVEFAGYAGHCALLSAAVYRIIWALAFNETDERGLW